MMINHTFTRVNREESLGGSRFLIATYPNDIIGTLTLTLEYEVRTYIHILASRDYSENDKEYLVNQIMSLVNTKHDNYLIQIPFTGDKAYFQVEFNEFPIESAGLPRIERRDSNGLLCIEYTPHKIELTGRVYGYKIPLEVKS
jgi:hypothetical protein